MNVWSSVYAQQPVSGIVRDGSTGEPLENATLRLQQAKIHTHTAGDGSFTLQVAQLPDTLLVFYTGYKPQTFPVDGNSANLIVEMNTLPVELAQVVVVSNQLLNQIMKVDLEMNPVNTSQDLLRKTPGLFISQHAGGGKAEQIFLRGFDCDHGTDVRLSVDNLPVNMVSHAHGQGYSDLHFVIPETVENIDFGKGAYYADKGDFTTGGYVNLKTFDRVDRSQLKIEGGMFNTARLVSVLNLLNETANNRQSMYVAGEYNYTHGPFDKPQYFNRINLFAKYNRRINEQTQIGLTASTFSSKWDASGQIPERAVNEKLISRWGSIDSTEGGNTGRTNLALTVQQTLNENTKWQSLFYYTRYQFNLFSNFTLFLNDPEYGDEIQQREDRNIYGMEHTYTKHFLTGESDWLWKSGAGLRYDDIGNIELNHVFQRETLLEPLSAGAIGETNLNAFTFLEWQKGKWMFNPGLRFDYFMFNVEDRLQPAGATQGQTAARFSPKLNIFYNINPHYQLFLKTGMGFHSNDARVVIAQQGNETLPYSLEGDLGVVFKPLPGLVIQPSLWYLYLQQEFVYVGDEAVVEPAGETQRYGVDLSVRYQPLKWLYLDADINYAHARALGEPEGENYIPLAPALTSVGGVSIRFDSGLTAGLRYRYMKDRPANDDNSVVAKGYFVNDLTLACPIRNWEISVQAQNLFNVKWNEAQFDTETRLRNEAEPVSEICFTPGNPFFLKAGLKINF
jgi:outer membrane cobalamin receptor